MRLPAFCALAVAIASVCAGPCTAQGWPTRTVKVIVPFPAGSTPDFATRLVTDRLQAKLSQPFIVENRAGASGNIGTDAIAKAEPDGYTIGVSIGGPLAVNTLLYPRLPYDPAKDLAPITLLTVQPSILVVNNDLPARSAAELVALLKADPGRYNYGSIGNGSLSHLAMEAIAMRSATRPTHIPYPGSPAALTALMRGDVQMAVLPAGSVVAQAEAGQIRMLAVTAPERSPLLPDLPTLREADIPEVEANAWNGFVAPARTPEPILARLGAAIRDVLAEPEVRAKLRVQVMEAGGGSAEAFRETIRGELARWEPVIRANNIRIGN